MGRIYTWVGAVLTGTYFAFLFYLFHTRVGEILAMHPDAFGNFAAGVFGPLAFVWLVLGYLQQGIELRQNTKALDLQAKELQASVDQQRELVQIEQKKLEHDMRVIREEQTRYARAAEPRLEVTRCSWSMRSGNEIFDWNMVIVNAGATITSVNVATDTIDFDPKTFSVWANSVERTFKFKFENQRLPQKRYSVAFTYTDSAGAKGATKFAIDPIEGTDRVAVSEDFSI